MKGAREFGVKIFEIFLFILILMNTTKAVAAGQAARFARCKTTGCPGHYAVYQSMKEQGE